MSKHKLRKRNKSDVPSGLSASLTIVSAERKVMKRSLEQQWFLTQMPMAAFKHSDCQSSERTTFRILPSYHILSDALSFLKKHKETRLLRIKETITSRATPFSNKTQSKQDSRFFFY